MSEPVTAMAATETGSRAARALDDLYRAHVSEVYRYSYAVLGNHADAEDVTQTTFVNALRALERGDSPRKPSNWLITIAHNIVRQRFRTQQVRPAEVELAGDVAAFEPPDSDGPSLDDLVRALQRIPASQREALVLRELEGRSYKEIQLILELSPGALETLLFRARRSLAEEIENVVTCERAERAMSQSQDGRLSRKERRRLDEHLRECPTCTRMQARHLKYRHAFKALAVVPLPLSLTFFKGAPSAAAATGLPTIGIGSVAAAGGGSVAAAGGGGVGATGGILAGGMAVKAAALVAAATVAGGVGYEGVSQVRQQAPASPPAVASTSVTEPVSRRARGEVAGPSGHRAAPEASARSDRAGATGRAASAARRSSLASGNANAAAAGKAWAAKERSQGRSAGAGAKARRPIAAAAAKPAQKAGQRNRPIGATKPTGAAVVQTGTTRNTERPLPVKRAPGPTAPDVAPLRADTDPGTSGAGAVEPGKGREKER